MARALRSGRWNESLEAHVRECATCREVQRAAQWMQALAPAAQLGKQSSHDLPDPRILWLRAQLSERDAAAERTQRVMQRVEVACFAAACAGLAVWLGFHWNAIGGEIIEGLNWMFFDGWSALLANLSAYGPANAPVLSLLALGLISLITVGVAYPFVARE